MKKLILTLIISLLFFSVASGAGATAGVTICPTEYGEPVMIGTQTGPYFFTPKAIVIHHSADGGVTPENEAWKWEGYRNYHMLTVHPGIYPEWTGIYVAQQEYPDGLSWPAQKDYNDIDYHFGVGPSGTVYQGRSVKTIGWHAGGALPGMPEINTYALGVCAMGDFTYYPPPKAQYDSLVSLTASLCIEYQITFDQIYGHKEIRWTTACPGNSFPLSQFKEDVRMKIGGFWDVSYNDWFWNSLHTLTASGILTGYDDKTFQPDKPVTRAEFISALYRLEGGKPAYTLFPDCYGHWAMNAISWAKASGIVQGFPDLGFHPDEPITRAQVAVVLFNLTHNVQYFADFQDVGLDHWAYGFIGSMQHMGYMNGYSDRTFRPDNPLLRKEMAAILVRVK